MAFELHAAIVDPGDGEIKVEHIFYGETEAECNDYFKEHLGTCSYFRAAEKESKVISWLKPTDELPTAASMDELAEAEDVSADDDEEK